MTRKDYQLIADEISASIGRSNVEVDDCVYIKASDLIAGLCIALQDDNDKFDMGKFTRACKGIAQ